MNNKREEALKLSEEILADIELSSISPTAIVRKASRLARLLDDVSAMSWLHHEITGYASTSENKLEPLGWMAATKSKRTYYNAKAEQVANVHSLSQLQAEVEAGKLQFAAAADASYQISSANQYQVVQPPKGNGLERNTLRNSIATNQALIDKVVGSVHEYVSKINVELRFGAAVESAFEIVRKKVDGKISDLIPNAMPILTTALENAQTNNQVQWNNAAKACRDLIKAAADALRPPGEDVRGIKMGEENYINRLVDWAQINILSTTRRNLVTKDLEYLGHRLDAVTITGHKGAHADVTQEDASRFIVGTYLLLGDILNVEKNKEESQLEDEGPTVPKNIKSTSRKTKKDT